MSYNELYKNKNRTYALLFKPTYNYYRKATQQPSGESVVIFNIRRYRWTSIESFAVDHLADKTKAMIQTKFH